MAEQLCPHCGSKYVSYTGKEETADAILHAYYCENCKEGFTVTQDVSSGSRWLMTVAGDSKEIKVYKQGDSYTLVQKDFNGTLRKNMAPNVQVHNADGYGVQLDTPYLLWFDTFTHLNDSTGFYVEPLEVTLNDELTAQALENPAMKAIHVKGNQFACRKGGYENSVLLDDLADWFNEVLGNYSHSAQGGSGGCYVATCVYGSYDCPQVWTLRRFRDGILAESALGRGFIRTYYAVSPTVVRWFGKTAWFRKLWRGVLDRMVGRLNARGVQNTPYKDRNW